jgi:GAF domain-containing protein
VLGVIASSPGELTPVFDAMLERAMRLCEAAFGILWTHDGEHLHAVAHRGVPPAYAEFLTTVTHPSDTDPLTQRFLGGERFIHLDAINEYYRADNRYARALADLGGGRSLLSVPLRRDGVLLGFFIVYWRELRGVDDRQITLLENFAAQAVIAMANARLITETREALEQQTATAEVLRVINSSPGDLAPVFDAMLEKAMRLCGADFGVMNTYDGEAFHPAAGPGHTRGLRRVAAAEPDDTIWAGYGAGPLHRR